MIWSTSAQRKGGGRVSFWWLLSHWMLVGVIWKQEGCQTSYQTRHKNKKTRRQKQTRNLESNLQTKLTWSVWPKVPFPAGTPWPLPCATSCMYVCIRMKRHIFIIANCEDQTHILELLGRQVGHLGTTLVLGLLDRLRTADSANIYRCHHNIKRCFQEIIFRLEWFIRMPNYLLISAFCIKLYLCWPE